MALPAYDVTAAVIERDNKVFCARRAAHKDLAGFWEFPGGKIEPSESFVGCLQRELKEELGIEAKVEKYLMTTTHQYPDKLIRLYVYRVAWLTGELTCSDHDETCWLPVARLRELKWAPADLPILDYLASDSRTTK
ncbi:(deoxy)nucleoside triphosphate pyrophosphohydrolase [Reinekea marinisedimentorum]|uniref:8-oxo-dGTP diphosphatase n=1 Tax=Reinekea marinisedimentorum TaxID=230495 RepID=A0A4R3IB75_9GAMM|nr:(deoxy)nucleoside triphosphate pyrophosphohydrolase [Reinekea marinisedimentorum]TCS43859.1 8-oxo-dGTP diphosphatase [Reinekea marinisedimentorum]